MSWLQTADAVKAIVESLAIILAGGWAVRRYVFHKESYPRVTFFVEVHFVGRFDDYWLVELLGLVENKGAVPHVMTEFNFELRCLRDGTPVRDGDPQINRQTEIPEVLKQGSWLPQQKERFILQPGISLRYNHIAHVPIDARFVLLHGVLSLRRHLLARADRLCVVPPTGDTGARADNHQDAVGGSSRLMHSPSAGEAISG